MSYWVPEALVGLVQAGTAVVVPLSGYSRLGIVLEVVEREASRSLEEVQRVESGTSLGPELVGLCRWISENTAVPLPVMLRNALPPGLRGGLYRVVSPASGWSWRRGTHVERATLRRVLGKDGFKEAESEGRIALSSAPARRESLEWAVLCDADPDLSRAPRQRELFEMIRSRGACRVRSLLEETGARRQTLKGLVERGAVRLERRSGGSAIVVARGFYERPRSATLEETLERRGPYLWRVPGDEQIGTVVGLCRAAVQRWEQTLVLVPEVREVERIVAELAELLPSGITIAPYHSGLSRERATVYEAARQGAVDVLVGTRAAALIPLSRPGAICIVDEPNPSHRAEPGFEGIPMHVREISLERGRREGSTVMMLSPAPSLALYSASEEGRVSELPALSPATWPNARIVDMRGSGAAIGRDLVQVCLGESEGRCGVVVNRLGYATSVYCASCGTVVACGGCGMLVVLHGDFSKYGPKDGREMVCYYCAAREPAPRSCAECGSERLTATGLAVERARDLLAERLGEEVGISTAGRRSRPDARVVVGTAHEILSETWDTVLVPDADSLLFGGGMYAAERGFRTLYSAAAAARRRVAVQTRDPENAVLGAALHGDYPAFAEHELPRRRRAGYPPYRHLAALTLNGPEAAVRRAIESIMQPRKARVEALALVPLVNESLADTWRVVLRSRKRPALAEAISAAAEIPPISAARRSGNGWNGEEVRRIQIELDPEEV